MSDLYSDNQARLDQLQMFGIKLGLEQTAALFARCGAPLTLRYLHLAGTNGKGSTGAMLEAALRGVGFRTGFYSSPHLVELRERFLVQGELVAEAAFNAAFARVEAASAALRRESGMAVTYFEFTTALAALIFQDAQVDFTIWETGMGGRCDATSVVDPELAVITGIALDHQQYLGNTIAAIAGEKAGIIRGGRPLFTGPLLPEAKFVIQAKAAELGAAYHEPDDAAIDRVAYGRDECGLYQEFRHRGRMIRLHLAGSMQRRNFRTVYPVLAFLAEKYHFSLDAALDALATAAWPGRCQEFDGGRWLIDGGHNPEGAAALAEALLEVFPGEKFTIVFAGFRDKDVAANLRELAELAAEFIFTPLRESRPSCSAAELGGLLQSIAPGVPWRAATDPMNAFALAESRLPRRVAAGSLYLVGEFLAARRA